MSKVISNVDWSKPVELVDKFGHSDDAMDLKVITSLGEPVFGYDVAAVYRYKDIVKFFYFMKGDNRAFIHNQVRGDFFQSTAIVRNSLPKKVMKYYNIYKEGVESKFYMTYEDAYENRFKGWGWQFKGWQYVNTACVYIEE